MTVAQVAIGRAKDLPSPFRGYLPPYLYRMTDYRAGYRSRVLWWLIRAAMGRPTQGKPSEVLYRTKSPKARDAIAMEDSLQASQPNQIILRHLHQRMVVRWVNQETVVCHVDIGWDDYTVGDLDQNLARTGQLRRDFDSFDSSL